MDDLEVLLADLSREPAPAESLRRVAQGVESKLRRRRMIQYFLAAAAIVTVCALSLQEMERRAMDEIALPRAVEAVFPAPDLFFSVPPLGPPVPASVSRVRPALKRTQAPKWVGEAMVQLPSSDPNILILWDLSQEEGGGL